MEENKVEKQEIETNVVKPSMNLAIGSEVLRLISVDDENKLDTLLSNIEDFMSSNSGKGKSEEDKDALYLNAQNMWHQYAELLRNVKFNLYFNRKQYNFLTNLLLKKLEYNVDTVFVAIELSSLLVSWRENSKYENDDSVLSYQGNPTEITYIYHLISKYSVKGLVDETFRFAEILSRIADASKIINYYDSVAKNMASDITDWVSSFEDGVEVEKSKKEEVLN